MATLGERIREARLSKELTQEALAELLGVARPTVTQWETGRREPDNVALLRSLAHHLGVSVDWLAGTPETNGEAEPQPEIRALLRSMKGLSEVERQDVLNYIAWKRAQARQKKQSPQERDGESDPL